MLQANKEITFDQIGGLKRQIRMINEIINFIPPAGRFDNNLGNSPFALRSANEGD